MFWQIKIKQNKNSEYGLQQELIGNSREKLYLLNAMHKHDIYMFDCYIDLTWLLKNIPQFTFVLFPCRGVILWEIGFSYDWNVNDW